MTAPLSADLIVDNCGQVVTCDATRGVGGVGVVERGAVAALGERLVWIGPAARLTAEVTPARGCRRIDAGGRLALPGFVDSHTHVVFAGTREREHAMRAGGASYQEIAAAGGYGVNHVRQVIKRGRVVRAAAPDSLVGVA